MGWFGPSGDCGCCGGCWSCAKPRGISIVNDPYPLGGGVCNCDTADGTYLIASATYDALTDPNGSPACTATWQTLTTCCEYDSAGYYISDRLKWDFTLKNFLSSGNPAVTITVSLTHARIRIIDFGSGSGDACAKDWDYFPALPVTEDQIIDGYYLLSTYRKWYRYVATFQRIYTAPNCPEDEDVITHISTFPDGNDNTLAGCDYATIIAKILM